MKHKKFSHKNYINFFIKISSASPKNSI
jgi:hypothetical protein